MHVNVLWGGAHYISYTHTHTPHTLHYTCITLTHITHQVMLSLAFQYLFQLGSCAMDNLRGDAIAQQVTPIVVACLLQGGDTLRAPMYPCLFPRSIPAS